MSSRRLILIDSHAVMYRSFHAIPGLSAASGRPTNAVFGFIRMVRQLIEKRRPTHMVSVFDGGIPARRRELLPAYKAQRPPMPENLACQFDLATEYLDRATIPWIRMDGEEADDVIATLVRQAEQGDCDTMVVTSDKDLYQLVSGRTSIVSPAGGAEVVMTEDDVKKKTGVAPDRIVEWLALVGDTSDNIDGVPGVGVKTAARLLSGHGSIEGIYRDMESIAAPAVKDSLARNREIVLRNVELCRLKSDLDCRLDWEKSRIRPDNPAELLPFLRSLDLNSLAREVEKASENFSFDA